MTVYAVDIKPEARALALELGAVQAFDLATLNEKITTGKLVVDVTIDFVATSQSPCEFISLHTRSLTLIDWQTISLPIFPFSSEAQRSAIRRRPEGGLSAFLG